MKQLRPKEEQIAARAYHIYAKNGSQPGHNTDDWLQAEYELMHRPLRMLAAMRPQEAYKGESRKKSIVDFVHAKWFTPRRAVPIHGALPHGLSNN
jgi:hypothetical protein